MDNFIIGGILVIIIGLAIRYIVKAKKSGAKCIGCPADGSCHSKKGGQSECCCGCGGSSDTKEEK